MLNITYKLISAPCKLTKHSVCAFFGLIPVFFGNVIAMYRANFYVNIRERHLIQHQTATGVKGFADNDSCLDFYAIFINRFA